MSAAESIAVPGSSWGRWEVPEFRRETFTPRRHPFCIVVFVLNEGEKIRRQLAELSAHADTVDIVVADGGSTDGALDRAYLRDHRVRALLTKTGQGKLSAQMRMVFAWALREGYKGIIVIDGNGKDGLEAVPRFAQLLERGYDHIQGSRFIKGGRAVNTPILRLIGLRLVHAPLISAAARRRYTDTTNGFRAYSARLLSDERVAVFRKIFTTYELHYHLAIESSRLGFRTIETPVTRTYPKHGATPTKISPIRGNAHVFGVLIRAVRGAYRLEDEQ